MYDVESYFPGLNELDEWQQWDNITIEHEIQYFSHFQDEFVRRIDMPQTKGALHINNCEDLAYCFWVIDEVTVLDTIQ